MRCKVCDYRLWNLRSRHCPECNTPFVPSDYEFVPNSIQFICPHCSQAYFGTADNGHLVPNEFDCMGCSRHVHMDEMVLLPTSGIEEEQTFPDRLAWLERGERGFFRSWLGTVGKALVAPGRLIKSVPIASSLPSAWWFMTLNHLPIFLLGFLGFFMAIGYGIAVGGGGGAMLAGIGFGMGIMICVGLLGLSAYVGLWGGITHGALCVVAQPAGGFRRTYQALCYSSGANVICAIPCVGPYFGWIWWLVSAVLMVKQGQQVSGWRASAAVLLLPGVSLLCIIGLYGWMLAVFIPQAFGMNRMQTQAVLTWTTGYAADHNGQDLDHGALLLVDPQFPYDNLIGMNTDTYEEDVLIAGTTLEKFVTLPTSQKKSLTRSAADALPPNTVAHRLGDYLFLNGTIKASKASDPLWVILYWPDPGSNDPLQASNPIIMGQADGTVIQTIFGQFSKMLVGQNQLRQSAGLAPLPDLSGVTHAEPAVAEPTD